MMKVAPDFFRRFSKNNMLAATLVLLAPAIFAQDVGRTEIQQSASVQGVPATQATRIEPFQSIADADKVLADAAKERERIEARYVEGAHNCNGKFFTTSCLDKAKETRRRDLANLHSIEVDARAYKRRTKAEEHERAVVRKREADER